MSPTTTLIDFRHATGHNLSLDLARHLPCRLQAGRVLVIANNPRIFSSVLCRRWTNLLKEVELQTCLTMDRPKKQLLRSELDRLQKVHISSKDSPQTNILVVTPAALASHLVPAATLYLTAQAGEHTGAVFSAVRPGGLIVVYREFWDDFGYTLQQHILDGKQNDC